MTDTQSPPHDEDFGPLLSFAQNFEDVMLWRALKHVTPGFYIDIGAQDPIIDSVSLGFYKKGWRGVHVEPTLHYADRLRAERPDEAVIQSAIAKTPGMLKFFEVVETGLSTGDSAIAETHRQAGHEVIETTVPAMTLDALLDSYADRDIHWLKIDVEGLEQQVIESWGKSPVRPWILVIESTRPGTQIASDREWEKLLTGKGYKAVYFDGLNRFYLAEGHGDLADHFAVGPNCFDDFVFSGESTNRFCQVLNKHIAWLQQIITYRDKTMADQAATADAAFALRDDALAKTKAHIQQVEGWLNSLHERHQDALATTLASHLRANQALNQLAVLQQELAALRQESNAQIVDLTARLHGAEIRLSETLASTSWRVTAPLRGLAHLVARRRGVPAAAIPAVAIPATVETPEPAAPPATVEIAADQPPPAIVLGRTMRLVIDLQGAQGENRGRGIGRYSLAMTEALIRKAAGREVIVVLNGRLAEQDPGLLDRLAALLPRQQIKLWTAPERVGATEPDRGRQRECGEILREVFLASLRPDLVYVTSLFEGLTSDAVTSIGRGNAPYPCAVTVYDLIPLLHPRIYLSPYPETERWYLRKLDDLRRADLCIAISQSSRREAIDHLGFAPDQVIVAPAAVEADFSPRQLTQAEEMRLRDRLQLTHPFLLYTGGIDPRKNVDLLIKSFAALPAQQRDGYQLAIVCTISEEERSRLRRLAIGEGLPAERLVLTGHVPDEDLIALYSICHLFVFPSWHEGFGLPALEAMACGAAVIAADSTSLPEVIGRQDALFAVNDQPALTAKIASVLADDEFRQELRDYGLRQARNFSWDKAAEAAWDGFSRFAARRPIPPASPPRPRLAFVSPLPPARSGIADYSAELLPELARHYQIEIVTDQPEVSDHWVDANCPRRDPAWFADNAQSYDRILYHFGNSAFHRTMFEMLRRHPGVVVLHDFFLSGVIADAEWGHGEQHAWSRALYESHGYTALCERFRSGDERAVLFKYPCTLPVLRQAVAIIVHSHFPQRLMRRWYGPVFDDKLSVIPLLRSPATAIDREMARQKLGLPLDEFIVCSFGILGPIKQNSRLLAAWLGSKMAPDRQCRLIFAGENEPGDYGRAFVAAIDASGTADRIAITGFLSPEDYRLYLQAADVAVQLRADSRGETSAAVLDCMNYGLPLIVNAHGAMADLPEDCVWRVQDRFTDEELAAALDEVRRDHSERRRRSVRAWEEIRRHHAPRPIADRYAQVIEDCYRRPETHLAVAALDDELAESRRLTFPKAQPLKQLFVDVSELAQRDAKSGIQRVVRHILRQLLDNPPEGYRVEPVYASLDDGYRYARQFALGVLGLPAELLADAPIDFAAGDRFLGLDLQPVVIPRHRDFFRRLRLHGVRVDFVVYDLLCVERPDCFDSGTAERFGHWLNEVAECDGAMCISAAVAGSMQSWLTEHRPDRVPHFAIGHFPLGAESVILAEESGSPPVPAGAGAGGGPLLLMVGTIEPRKGYRAVLDAADQLWAEGVSFRLAIAGKNGWLVEHLVERLRAHPDLADRLFWFEGTDDATLARLYRDADGLILASEGEGFGLPLVEAGFHDLPILARDLPVFREVAGDKARYFAADLTGSLKSWLGEIAAGTAPRSKEIGRVTWADSARQLLSGLALADQAVPPQDEPAVDGAAGEELPSASPLQIYAGYELADIALMRRYATETAVIGADLLIDGFGTRTPRDNVGFCQQFRSDRLQLPVPDDGFHAETIEYAALLDSLERAPAGRFSAVEIGAAWGPWLSMGGVVARRAGREIQLVGVEADPERFKQLQRQMRANGLDSARLIEGAAGASAGSLWFPKLNVTDLGAAASAENRSQDYRGAAIESYEVRAYTLAEIFDGMDQIDFLHVDIQGAEYDLLSANVDLLREKVSTMLIGTHSRVIEGQLIALLDRDWSLHREKPCRVDWSAATPDLSGRTINDGCQYWRRRDLV